MTTFKPYTDLEEPKNLVISKWTQNENQIEKE